MSSDESLKHLEGMLSSMLQDIKTRQMDSPCQEVPDKSTSTLEDSTLPSLSSDTRLHILYAPNTEMERFRESLKPLNKDTTR